MKKKGQAVLYIFFFIAALIIVVIAAVLAPIGVLFNTKMFVEGEGILNMASEDIANIQDATVRNAVNSTVNSAKDAAQNNIEVNGAIFQYAWVIVIVLTGVIVFLQARRLIEVGAGGFI